MSAPPAEKDALATGSGGQTRVSSGLTDAEYSSAGAMMFRTMGMATMMSQAEFDRKFVAIQNVVQAKTREQRSLLEVSLVFYFSAHGTSPETPWANYDKPFVFEGRTYSPYKIVSEVGEGRLKQFLARFSDHVPKLFANSSEYRRAMAERAGRLGLDPDDGIFAVDFYGKDGSLDSASMGMKSTARNRALNYRSANVSGVMSQTRQAAAESRNDSPPVVPLGLKQSFKNSVN